MPRRRAPDSPGPTSMTGKTVLVTGGTEGIGKATAAGLVRLGARVGIVGRDLERARAAADDIRAVDAQVFVADLSSQAEVRRVAGEALATYRRLDVLINNVGGFWASRHVTADGLEHTFDVNHLAPFLLTNLLLERLSAAGDARIVTVSSGAHTSGRLDFADLQGEQSYAGDRAYSQSKLANVLFTYELSRRPDGAGATANVLHPGVVRTSFGAKDQLPVWTLVAPLVRPFLKDPARGAATSIHLAASDQVQGVTGSYFVNRRPRSSGKRSYDLEAAGRLWQVSAELVGL